MESISPLQLAESLRHKKDFVWLDSLVPSASAIPVEQGLSLLAAEPDLIIEGGPNDWPLLEKELKNRLKENSSKTDSYTKTPPFKLANTCGVAAAGSTAEGSPEGASLAGASELHHKIKISINFFLWELSSLIT